MNKLYILVFLVFVSSIAMFFVGQNNEQTTIKTVSEKFQIATYHLTKNQNMSFFNPLVSCQRKNDDLHSYKCFVMFDDFSNQKIVTFEASCWTDYNFDCYYSFIFFREANRTWGVNYFRSVVFNKNNEVEIK